MVEFEQRPVLMTAEAIKAASARLWEEGHRYALAEGKAPEAAQKTALAASLAVDFAAQALRHLAEGDSALFLASCRIAARYADAASGPFNCDAADEDAARRKRTQAEAEAAKAGALA